MVLNTLNLAKPAAGPTLLTVAEVITLFHEFGHALHGLLSDVAYPTFAGTGVPRDFVEFPSQVNEMWLRDPAIVARYARHHVTGEPLPADLRRAADRPGARCSARASRPPSTSPPRCSTWPGTASRRARRSTTSRRSRRRRWPRPGVAVPTVPPRYRSAYFNHVFAGAYSAAYYSYIWSEVLDADTVEWFAEHGGLRRRERRDVPRGRCSSRGGSVDPMEAYRAFRGRDPEIGPLLARRGLESVSAAATDA